MGTLFHNWRCSVPAVAESNNVKQAFDMEHYLVTAKPKADRLGNLLECRFLLQRPRSIPEVGLSTPYKLSSNALKGLQGKRIYMVSSIELGPQRQTGDQSLQTGAKQQCCNELQLRRTLLGTKAKSL